MKDREARRLIEGIQRHLVFSVKLHHKENERLENLLIALLGYLNLTFLEIPAQPKQYQIIKDRKE